jgi:hypothetical protein
MIVVTVFFMALIFGTVIWVLDGVGRILMHEDQKDAIEDEDEFPHAR